jgi:hypothetical protein
MADKYVHSDSVEVAYIPVRNAHPINLDSDLSNLAVEVALPEDGSPPTNWVASAWESGTMRIDNNRYYLVGINLGTDFSVTSGTAYQPWARVTLEGSDKAYVKAGGRIVGKDT